MSSFASLHSGLIARKGEAAPANRHSAFSYVDEVRRDVSREALKEQEPQKAEEHEEEIYHIEQRPSLFNRPANPVPASHAPELPKDELEPAAEADADKAFANSEPDPVPATVEPEAQTPAAYEPAPAPEPVSEPVAPVVAASAHKHDDADEHTGPYRLTFRMTADQRRRLRIAAAKQDTSLQHVLADALDNHLDGLCACSLSECTCLAREAAE